MSGFWKVKGVILDSVLVLAGLLAGITAWHEHWIAVLCGAAAVVGGVCARTLQRALLRAVLVVAAAVVGLLGPDLFTKPFDTRGGSSPSEIELFGGLAVVAFFPALGASSLACMLGMLASRRRTR